jgi:1-deoxy-D-xylulose-5-phosphate reductoisomerase
MKKKIAVLGSTGSIGESTLAIIDKDKNNFEVILLSANNNYKKLIKQAKKFNAKNVLIYNKKFHSIVKKSLKNTNVYSGKTPLTKIIKKKLDYTMSSIVGLAGLQPTIDAVKISKTLALANKETIICAWPILDKLKRKYKTEIIPVDSEHYSIMELTKNVLDNDIEEIIITASGGPFLKTKIKKLSKVKPKEAIKHPNWKMGKKISVDSANLMNKVFEVLEAHQLFNFNVKKYKIMIHPQSYVHSIIRFRNGLIKMILYNTDMKIPISNTIYKKSNNFLNEKKILIKKLNNLKFQTVNKKRFPSVNFIKKCLNLGPSSGNILNASNEVLVELFLESKIGFLDIVKTLKKIFKDKKFKKYAKRKPNTVEEIKIIDNWARLKTKHICVR